jgi:DNA-binding response OmpR family regulator
MPNQGGYYMADDGRRGTILVVDDNPDIRGLAKFFLENAGYTVVMAADGAEGLRFYRENQSSILLLLTDITMPNMNGLELVMSGLACGAYPGLESIAKPFRPDELIERVGRVLDARVNPERAVSAA